MTSVKDQIKEASRFTRMRLGQDAPEETQIPSMQVRAAIVPLSERETQAGLIRASKVDVPDNAAGLATRDRVAMENDVFHCLRELDDPAKKVFDSVEEMVEMLDSTDIDYLHVELTTLSAFASPSLGSMTDEDVDNLKKVFVTIDPRELSGRPAAALMHFISLTMPSLLGVSRFGFGSTSSSTTTNGDGESTSDASQSSPKSDAKSVESQ